jgi:hypothetical protein
MPAFFVAAASRQSTQKIIFTGHETFADDRLLWLRRLVDNKHACFDVSVGFFRDRSAMPGPDRPEIRTADAGTL